MAKMRLFFDIPKLVFAYPVRESQLDKTSFQISELKGTKALLGLRRNLHFSPYAFEM